MSKRYIGFDLSPKRIETLNEGVFAIVMTLLVLNLTIPELKNQRLRNCRKNCSKCSPNSMPIF
ncbi:MAG: TMEM175 family protein [Candidatus Wukongarchaeota archaeon]